MSYCFPRFRTLWPIDLLASGQPVLLLLQPRCNTVHWVFTFLHWLKFQTRPSVYIRSLHSFTGQNSQPGHQYTLGLYISSLDKIPNQTISVHSVFTSIHWPKFQTRLSVYIRSLHSFTGQNSKRGHQYTLGLYISSLAKIPNQTISIHSVFTSIHWTKFQTRLSVYNGILHNNNDFIAIALFHVKHAQMR